MSEARARSEEDERKKRKPKPEEDEEEEEEEDEDDEDEEEDEDSEEEEAPRSKAKRRKNKKSRLLIDEASEGSSEEEVDEGEIELDENEDVLTPYERERRAERMKKEQDFRMASAEELAEQYQQRYREKGTVSKGASGKFSGAATIETARLMRERPRTEDPKLFMVKCKPGDEKVLVLKLFNKYIRDKFKKPEPVDLNARKSRWSLPPPPGAELEIFSVLAPGTTGYIYVESMREDCVKAAVRGVSGIFSGKISIVPIEEMQDVMRVEQRKDIVRKDDYVRMRGPFPYKGDLGKIFAVLDGGNKVTVMLVPRIDMTTLTMDVSGKNAGKIAPPAKHFNPDEIREAGGNVGRDPYPSTNEMLDSFEGYFFKNGFLLLDISARQVQLLTEKPSLSELERFVAPLVASKKEDEVEAIAREMEKVASKQKKETYDFSVGDRVMVVSGPETGAEGLLENVDNLRSMGTVRIGSLKVEIGLKDLVKQFSVGDHVKVMVGKYQGKTGNVVSVPSLLPGARPYVIVYTDLGSGEIQVYNSEINVSSEVSAGMDELNGYKLHDLVMLDQNQHGVLIRLNPDTVRVLIQTGEVKEVPISGIRAKKNMESKRATAPDANNHPLRVQDHVIIALGQYRGAEGVIRQIFKMMLFVYCKAREHDNAGMIVVKSRDCRLAGSLQQPGKAVPAFPGAMNPSMRPPAMPRGPHGGGAGAGRGHARDELHGKTIRIRRGNDKGLLGTVVEGGSAGALRVELNARNRIIIVQRDNIELVDAKPAHVDAPQQQQAYSAPSDDQRSYARPYPPPSYAAAYSAPAPVYSTPMSNIGDASKVGRAPGQGAGNASTQYRKGDEVTLVDTGESVKIYEVVDRDIVVVDKKGKMKIVSASNVVYA